MSDTAADTTDFTQGALAYMMRAAPERAQTLRKIFEEYGIQVRHPLGPWFEPGQPVDASPNAWGPVINWPPIMHALAWLLTHGGWEAMRDYGAAIGAAHEYGRDFDGAEIETTLAKLSNTGRCAEIVACARQVANGEEPPLSADTKVVTDRGLDAHPQPVPDQPRATPAGGR